LKRKRCFGPLSSLRSSPSFAAPPLLPSSTGCLLTRRVKGSSSPPESAAAARWRLARGGGGDGGERITAGPRTRVDRRAEAIPFAAGGGGGGGGGGSVAAAALAPVSAPAPAGAGGGDEARTSTLPLLAEWNPSASEEISISDIFLLLLLLQVEQVAKKKKLRSPLTLTQKRKKTASESARARARDCARERAPTFSLTALPAGFVSRCLRSIFSHAESEAAESTYLRARRRSRALQHGGPGAGKGDAERPRSADCVSLSASIVGPRRHPSRLPPPRPPPPNGEAAAAAPAPAPLGRPRRRLRRGRVPRRGGDRRLRLPARRPQDAPAGHRRRRGPLPLWRRPQRQAPRDRLEPPQHLRRRGGRGPLSGPDPDAGRPAA